MQLLPVHLRPSEDGIGGFDMTPQDSMKQVMLMILQFHLYDSIYLASQSSHSKGPKCTAAHQQVTEIGINGLPVHQDAPLALPDEHLQATPITTLTDCSVSHSAVEHQG